MKTPLIKSRLAETLFDLLLAVVPLALVALVGALLHLPGTQFFAILSIAMSKKFGSKIMNEQLDAINNEHLEFINRIIVRSTCSAVLALALSGVTASSLIAQKEGNNYFYFLLAVTSFSFSFGVSTAATIPGWLFKKYY